MNFRRDRIQSFLVTLGVTGSVDNGWQQSNPLLITTVLEKFGVLLWKLPFQKNLIVSDVN